MEPKSRDGSGQASVACMLYYYYIYHYYLQEKWSDAKCQQQRVHDTQWDVEDDDSGTQPWWWPRPACRPRWGRPRLVPSGRASTRSLQEDVRHDGEQYCRSADADHRVQVQLYSCTRVQRHFTRVLCNSTRVRNIYTPKRDFSSDQDP